MFTITNEFIENNKSSNNGWNKPQLACLGISWPPPKGWKKKIVGYQITDEQAETFSNLRNAKTQKH